MINKFENFISGNIMIKLAETEKEYNEVFKLRYQELLLEYDKDKKIEEEIDKDEYDEICDHLIAVDIEKDKVIGTYRLIKKSHLTTVKTFLTETEFNLDPLKKYEILEVGRAVVKQEYRDGVTIGMLWKGVIRYAVSEKVDIMIGTASFHGTDPKVYKNTLTYLYEKHLSPIDIRCYANKDSYSPLKLLEEYDELMVKKEMPPLVKGYINLGATIGDGVYIDKQFNSCDVLIVLVIKDINPRYLKRYL
jgi:putative hemolysin